MAARLQPRQQVGKDRAAAGEDVAQIGGRARLGQLLAQGGRDQRAGGALAGHPVAQVLRRERLQPRHLPVRQDRGLPGGDIDQRKDRKSHEVALRAITVQQRRDGVMLGHQEGMAARDRLGLAGAARGEGDQRNVALGRGGRHRDGRCP